MTLDEAIATAHRALDAFQKTEGGHRFSVTIEPCTAPNIKGYQVGMEHIVRPQPKDTPNAR